jgi:hypothetical protein
VVVPEYHGDSRQLGVELEAAVRAGTAPALVIRNPSDVWALDNAVVPVQTYVSDKRFGLTPDDLKDIYPAMLDMGRDPKDHTLLSFPLGGEGVVLVYDAERLAAQNYFTPPGSWRCSRRFVKRPRVTSPAIAAWMYMASASSRAPILLPPGSIAAVERS